MTEGVLLFAHGARDPRWATPFESVARRVGELVPERHVQLAFLEFMTPTLLDAGRALAAAGCTRVDVVPLFLGAGGHVRKDLPELLATLSGEHPTVDWRLKQTIGENPAVIAAMAAAAVTSSTGPSP